MRALTKDRREKTGTVLGQTASLWYGPLENHSHVASPPSVPGGPAADAGFVGRGLWLAKGDLKQTRTEAERFLRSLRQLEQRIGAKTAIGARPNQGRSRA